MLAEPVEVHQDLVVRLQDLDAGARARCAREVEAERFDVVVDTDEGAAGTGGLPVVEADDQREQHRAGEEEQEAEQVRRQEREAGQRALGARRRAEETSDVTTPDESSRSERGGGQQRVAIVTGWTMRSRTVEIRPLGSAATTNHADPMAATIQPARRSRRGPGAVGRFVGDLSGDEHPEQTHRDDQERYEGLAQAFAELADRRESAELVHERHGGDDEGEVADDQRHRATPSAALMDSERRCGVGDEGRDGEEPEEHADRRRELLVAAAAREQHHHHGGDSAGEVPQHDQLQAAFETARRRARAVLSDGRRLALRHGRIDHRHPLLEKLPEKPGHTVGEPITEQPADVHDVPGTSCTSTESLRHCVNRRQLSNAAAVSSQTLAA